MDEQRNQRALAYHAKEPAGKIATKVVKPASTREELSLAYSPGVAEPCRVIAADKTKVYDYTMKGRTVAVISDGSAVLGLGNIGPEAALPVMEGKAMLFKKFANVDAIPVCIQTQDTEEIIEFVKNIAPTFGGINLEDISAPRCFEIEQRLKDELDIPVFHDDQHGSAVVVLAGLINAAKLTNRDLKTAKIVINGAGAAGIATAKLLISYGCQNLVMCDSQGAIYEGRSDLNPYKEEIAKQTNHSQEQGNLAAVMANSDIFVGVSKAGLVSEEMVRSMNKEPIIIAMANPVPEILPEIAITAGARIVATGRSDYPNQVNNVLVFPGLFKGVLGARRTQITQKMLLAAADALASFVKNPSVDEIIPDPFAEGVAEVVAKAVIEVD